MTQKRKWILRISAGVGLAFAAAGTWAAFHLDELKAGFAARQVRSAASDEDRARAADKLTSLGDAGLVELMKLVRNGDEPTRGAAAGALERFIDTLPDGEQRAVIVAGQLLDAFPSCNTSGQRAILGLLPTVLKKTGNAHATRCKAAVASGLQLADPTARVLAVRLALHPEVKMRPNLLPLLTAQEAEVRQAALFAVASGGDEQVIADEDLFRWLHDPDAGVRKVCRDALVGRERSEVEINLGKRLADPDPLERLKLLLDLRYDDDVADPDPWLERLSRDPEPAVRAGAARVAVEVASARRLACPGWVNRVAEADGDGTVRRIALFFRRQPTGRVDPNVQPAILP